MKSERWLSADEVSEHLGVTTDTLYRWIEERSFPAHRVGRSWKFKRGRVDEWVESDEGDPRRTDDAERQLASDMSR